MNTRLITTWLMVIITSVLLIWDILVASNTIPDDTISEQIRLYAQKWPIIPFAFGVLIGHWFWK